MSYGVYIFFASCLVCAAIYAYFFIHETKGLRMDQMDQIFGFVERGTDYSATMKETQHEEIEHAQKTVANQDEKAA